MMSTVKINGLCVNCLRPGHFVKQCKSLHRCRRCQKPHHTLLHIENEQGSHTAPSSLDSAAKPITSNTAARLTTNTLLMTCRVLVDTPDGSSVEARALVDSASSASFMSERLAQTLSLSRAHQTTRISDLRGCWPIPQPSIAIDCKFQDSLHTSTRQENGSDRCCRSACDLRPAAPPCHL